MAGAAFFWYCVWRIAIGLAVAFWGFWQDLWSDWREAGHDGIDDRVR